VGDEGAAGAAVERVDVLVLGRDHADQRPDRDGVPLVDQPLAQHAIAARDELHDRLVGLDLTDRLAALDDVALVLEPLDEASLLHRRGECLHEDFGCHDR
jgi:hypothetical protein